MNKKLFAVKSFLIMPILAGFVACGGDNKETVASVPENSEELGECSAQNEGAEAYVEEKDEHYVCQNGEWIKITSSSSAAVSSSSDKTGVSSSSKKETSSSSKTEESSSSKGSSSSSSKTINDKSVYDASTKTLKDLRNNKTYKTTNIGYQVWMAENLNYEYNEGTAQSFCNDNKTENCTKYGRLYTWDAAMDKAGIFSKNGNPARGVCPKDWHLPSKAEFEELFKFLGGTDGAGRMLKSKSGWDSFENEVVNGTDEFDFNALPVGHITAKAEDGKGTEASFWSSTEDNDKNAYALFFWNYTYSGTLQGFNKKYAIPVRCIRNELGESELDIELGLCTENRNYEIATTASDKQYICEWKDGVGQWRKPTRDELIAEANRVAGENFLAQNRTAEGVVTTASGLQYKIITESSGATPTDGDIVIFHYTGTLLDGTKFDSSIDLGEPITATIGSLIPGWIELFKLMKVGEKVTAWIPSNLAFGREGRPPLIPSNSTLVFEIELLSIRSSTP